MEPWYSCACATGWTYAICRCTKPLRFDIAHWEMQCILCHPTLNKALTASTQSRMKWRCTTRNMLTNTMGQPTTSMRKVKHDHAIYCDSNKGLIMSRLNHLCSMSTKGCILQCHTKGIPIDMSSTNQRQHNPIFLSRTYTPKRFWSHGWYGLAGSSSLRKGGQELSLYDFEEVQQVKAARYSCFQETPEH